LHVSRSRAYVGQKPFLVRARVLGVWYAVGVWCAIVLGASTCMQ
jgi:hypothetical protein